MRSLNYTGPCFPNIPVGEGRVFPCSASQQPFWFITSLDPGNPAFNIALRFEITGRLSPATIERTFQTIIDRHEILRTRFFDQDGEPMQEVVDRSDFKLSVVDLTIVRESNRLEEATALGRREARRPFDTERLPLIRATLLRLDADRAFLLVTVHHLAFDGWSISILAHEFGVIAAALDAKRDHGLPELPLQYGDYCLWQKAYFASAGLDAEIAYWKSKLAGAPYFEVPPDHSRTLAKTYGGEIVAAVLPAALGDGLEQIGRQRNLTLFSFGCAVTAAMLRRLTGESDISFGTQIAGRDQTDLEDMIGLFINNLVMRFDASGDPTFEEFLSRVNASVQEALVHNKMPFHKLVEVLNPPRETNRAPLVSINFTVFRDVVNRQSFGAFDLCSLPSLSAGAVYDLNFFLAHWPNGWRIALEYNPDLYEKRTAERMIELMLAAFEFAFATPEARLSALASPVQSQIAPTAPEPAIKTAPSLNAEPDGLKELAGPTDRATINRNRIDLDEIENALRADPRVADATVLCFGDSPTQRLVAFLKLVQPAAAGEYGAGIDAVIAALRPKLPENVIPLAVVQLDAPPLSADRREDRQQLRESAERGLTAAVTTLTGSRMELMLAEIWRDVLNVAEVGPTSNFFELGGHSLLAVRLVARVASTFGVKVGVISLFEAPTPRAFAAAFLSGVETTMDSGRIVLIQPEGEKTPIIALGDTMIYYNLARKIGTDRPFLGISFFDPDGPAPARGRSLNDISADYVRLIREAQPRGPYILVGYCVMGAIAFEAARQLRSAGEQAPLVIMADTWAPGYVRRLPLARRMLAEATFRIHFLRHQFSQVRRGELSLAQLLAHYRLVRKSKILNLAVLLHLIKELPEGKDDGGDPGFLSYLMEARRRHAMSPAIGDVVILQSEIIVTHFTDPAMGWADLVKGRLHLHRIPGWHGEMFQNDGPSVIAEQLRPALEEVDAERDRSKLV